MNFKTGRDDKKLKKAFWATQGELLFF